MALVPGEEFFARLRGGAGSNANSPKGVLECSSCAVPLQESITGCRRLGDGSHVCSDCYFRKLSDALEQYPILTPRVRRAKS
jgi:hypothetical protein